MSTGSSTSGGFTSGGVSSGVTSSGVTSGGGMSGGGTNVADLTTEVAKSSDRIQMVQLDVTDDRSVA